MRKANNLPMSGIIEGLSAPVDHVEPGMFFSFDGGTLNIYSRNPLDGIQIMDIIFGDVQPNSSGADILIEGSIRPSGESIVFHVSRRSGVKDGGIYLRVVAYWVMEGSYELSQVSKLRLSGPCVESFSPMTNVQTSNVDGCLEITARTSSANSINLGLATIGKKEIDIFAETYWTYSFCECINFESRLICRIDSPDYELMKAIYTSFASALRFCLGRGNVDFVLELCIEEEAGYHVIGEFVALHGKRYIPDELDKPSACFLRADDIGMYFGEVVSAFSSGLFYSGELSQSRDDANIITYPKVIELTSSFEREFRELFPQGIKHRTKTQRDADLAKEAICKAAEGLAADPKRMLLRLSKRISEDNLESRIRYSCKSLSDDVAAAVFEGTGANRKNTHLGKKITELRNDIAHGNEPRHILSSVRGEYKLLIKLVFAMRLLRLQMPDEDIARLVKCKS